MNTNNVISVLSKIIDKNDIMLFANGRIVREALYLADRSRNFYMLLSMGHASSIGLGIALARPESKVIVVDGDGNLLMNFGILPLIGDLKPKNLIHIVIDNSSYGTTGGQQTVAKGELFSESALASGYKNSVTVTNAHVLKSEFLKYYSETGPSLIAVKAGKKYIKSPVFNLKPWYIKKRFMNSINK